MTMTSSQLNQILCNIKCLDRQFTFMLVDADISEGGVKYGFFVFVTYEELDVDTGVMALQKSRKWWIGPEASETDVVETCFAAVMRSYDHVVKEHFLYKGRRVYSPHFTIDQRLMIAPTQPGNCAKTVSVMLDGTPVQTLCHLPFGHKGKCNPAVDIDGTKE